MIAFTNPDILKRFDELIEQGTRILASLQRKGSLLGDEASEVTQWATSCLNLLDKLSVSTNRFVSEFERYGRLDPKGVINMALPLGVIRAARDEYVRGLAVDYELAVSAAVFGGLLDEAEYLLSKTYFRAAAVMIGAALEEGLKARARAVPVEISPRDTIQPLLAKLKAPGVGVLNEMQAQSLQAIGRLRNDAAHGGAFEYQSDDIARALAEVRRTLNALLGGG